MPKDKADTSRGSALEKALLVLETVAGQPQSIGLPDLTARTGLPRQTVHRILRQLEDNGLLLRDPSRDRYSIGARLSRLSLSTLHSANQGAPMRVILQDLVDDIRETCNIGVLDGLRFVYLDRIECDWPLRIHLTVGSRVPAHCTSGGKVLLAHLPADRRAALLRAGRLKSYTPNTITRVVELEKELDKIRADGYALNQQEFNVGIIGLAVPIAAADGPPPAALALHAPAVRLSTSRALKHVPKMKAAARRLAQVWRLDGDGG
jgi:DNA-binding IclR family transcriptional regulator